MAKNIVRLTTNDGNATMTHSGKHYATATIEVPDGEMKGLEREASFHNVTVEVLRREP